MRLSKHNIVSKVHHSDDYFIVNLLSGNADMLTKEEVGQLIEYEQNPKQEFIDKGYLVDPIQEDKLFRSKYLDFIDARDSDEIQLFYAPTFLCNFGCDYCYQDGYKKESSPHALDVAQAFFEYVRLNFNSKKKYITLFGGEPLLSGESNYSFIEYFVSQCNQMDIDLAVVTNGFTLSHYIPVLSKASIREIQITLDGTEHVHNLRRPLKTGKTTFFEITDGIDAALEAGFPVNLRMVLDKENIADLPAFAAFAIEKGWTRSSLFKSQLGRNYELHQCQSGNSRLYSRLDLYHDLYDLMVLHPHILEFHKPAYSVSKFLFENGELPDALFDSCPGCKTEWAFDFTGKIYSCTATVGKAGEELGTFYPSIVTDANKIDLWQQRDVLSITACKTCNLRLACGGGCASVAYNRDKNLHAPDCRPVRELIEMGIGLYSKMGCQI